MVVATRHRAIPATATETVVAIVAHARHVPSLEREAFAATLRACPADPARILVRTCHRVELYAAGRAADDLPSAELPPGVERLVDVDAVRHLLAVACGADSAVFGETQILHQLRETLEERHASAALDPVLDRLFQAALRAGREARTYFTGSPRSLADVALDRVAARVGDGQLAGRPILVVGVGRMGRLAAFAAARRGARVIVANRTASRAADLATEVGGTVMPFGSDGALPHVAGVVAAVSGPWPIGPRDMATLRSDHATVVDLSSPPAVQAPASLELGPGLVTVDDLADGDEDGPDGRLRTRLETLVSRVGLEYCQWLRSRHSVPAIRGVVEVAEERRATELEWLRRRLPDLDPDELEAVERMSHRLVAAILHGPLSALSADEDGELELAARELFGL